ncbi:MAG: methylmalonyl-CoA epimerase [Candidatus Cloacimonetes bacterium]|nr:methylmalonyl-CoA epimerase [Candidatus Cloacimonadota bacterium]
MIEKVSHIGIAVKSIEAALPFYHALGLEVEAIEEVASQKVRVAFLPVGKEVRLELLEPTSTESPVAKFIEKKGEGIHHLALATTNLQERLQELEEKGIRLIDKTPRPGAHGADIAFLHPQSTGGILLELCKENH